MCAEIDSAFGHVEDDQMRLLRERYLSANALGANLLAEIFNVHGPAKKPALRNLQFLRSAVTHFEFR
jgi:hypothetical protein